MTRRLKTLHHFIEEYPGKPPTKSWDDDDSMGGIIDNLEYFKSYSTNHRSLFILETGLHVPMSFVII